MPEQEREMFSQKSQLSVRARLSQPSLVLAPSWNKVTELTPVFMQIGPFMDPENAKRGVSMSTRLRLVPAVLVFALGFTANVSAQAPTTTCGEAVGQLQGYVQRVNAFANSEYYYGIPSRCMGNGACMQWWLAQLNAWYFQQSNLVNGWYSQIVTQCTAPTRRPTRKNVQLTKSSEEEVGGLDENAVEDLQVDDEDKTVRIKIPKTPNGFRK
jgi:hypothetical protein